MLLVGSGVVIAGVLVFAVSRSASASTAPPSESPSSCGPPFGELGGIEVMSGGAQRDDDVPVHVFMHGLGNKPAQMVKYMEAFREPARHIVLEGTTKHGTGRGWTSERCRSDDQEKLAAQISWTADRVAAAIDAIASCYGRPVIVSGFSNGGSIAYAIASRNLPNVERVVAVAGCLPVSLRTSSMTTTAGIHGTHDATVPFADTAIWASAHPSIAWRSIPNGGHSPNQATLDAWREAVLG